MNEGLNKIFTREELDDLFHCSVDDDGFVDFYNNAFVDLHDHIIQYCPELSKTWDGLSQKEKGWYLSVLWYGVVNTVKKFEKIAIENGELGVANET